MIAKIETRPVDRRIDHGETFDALASERAVKLSLRRDMATAERTVQTAEQADQYRTLSAIILERDLSFACDGLQDDVGRAIPRLKRSIDMTVWHAELPHIG
jgi:hypothetical protein